MHNIQFYWDNLLKIIGLADDMYVLYLYYVWRATYSSNLYDVVRVIIIPNIYTLLLFVIRKRSISNTYMYCVPHVMSG